MSFRPILFLALSLAVLSGCSSSEPGSESTTISGTVTADGASTLRKGAGAVEGAVVTAASVNA